MANIPLVVTRNWHFTDESPVTTAALNAAAAPLVEFPDGPYITKDNIDMDSILPDVVEAARNLNFMLNGCFYPEHWDAPAGVTVKDDTTAYENAASWYCRTTGADIQYERVEDSPSNLTAFAARVYGAPSMTKAELWSYLSPNYTAQISDTELVFSAWVYNATGASLRPTFIMRTSDAFEDRSIVTEQISQQAPIGQAIAPNTWGRCEWTFSSAAPDWLNGAQLGVFVGSQMDSTAKYFQIAQVQLEVGTVATEFKRPAPLANLVKKAAAAPVFSTDDRLTGAHILLQMTGQSNMRYLDKPPAAFLKPVLSWNPAGYPEWIETGSNKLVFQCTKSDQRFTSPCNGTMRIDAWGAGGMEDVGIQGGVGGYTWGEFPVSLGAEYSVVVGEGARAIHNTINPYGFGGKGSSDNHQWAGGGLSGVFTGPGAVLSTDTARALLIAGAGGAGGQTGGGSGAVQGGNGNDASNVGGNGSLQGHNSTGGLYGDGGGGGGYDGGGALGRGGKGGTGFLHASHTAGAIVGSVRPSKIVPGTSEPNYQAGIGGLQQPGLVVITFIPGGALSITTASPLAPGTSGVAISRTLASAGGVPSYVWTVDSGALPPGTTLSPAGVISGTPAPAATYNFVIRVTDGAGNFATKAFTLVIA